MSALADLLHDIVNRLHVFTEKEHQDMHETVNAVEDEIKSWTTQSPGLKTVDDVNTKETLTTADVPVQDTPVTLHE